MKTHTKIPLGACALALGALLALIGILAIAGVLTARPAHGVPVPLPVNIVQTGATTTSETIACNSNVSPCTVGASAVTLLNAAQLGRHECLIQNVNVTDLYCLKGSGTPSITNMHFILKAATAQNKGDGGSYSCNQGPLVWSGIISCVGSGASATPNVNVSAD